MWGFLKTAATLVFGGSSSSSGADNVMKVASGIGNWIDEQKLTDQERMEFNAKMVENYGKFMESTVGENTERSITRRQVAIAVIRVEIFCLLTYGVLASLKLDFANVWWRVAVDSPLGLLTLGVGAFFFGTHMLRSTKWGG